MQKKRKSFDPLLSALCGAIQERRESLGISQEELAGRCGLHRTYISAIERGSRNITLKSLSRLCGALQIATSDLVKAAEQRANDYDTDGQSAVADEIVEDLLDKLIDQLGGADSENGRELIMEALWIKHKLKDQRWAVPDGETTIARVLRQEGLRETPDAEQTAQQIVEVLPAWRRRNK